ERLVGFRQTVPGVVAPGVGTRAVEVRPDDRRAAAHGVVPALRRVVAIVEARGHAHGARAEAFPELAGNAERRRDLVAILLEDLIGVRVGDRRALTRLVRRIALDVALAERIQRLTALAQQLDLLHALVEQRLRYDDGLAYLRRGTVGVLDRDELRAVVLADVDVERAQAEDVVSVNVPYRLTAELGARVDAADD